MLVGAGLVVLFSTLWTYQKIESREGTDFAQATMVLTMVVLLTLISAGMVLAYFIFRAIKEQRMIFGSLRPGGWMEAFIRVWGFEIIEEKTQKDAEPASIPATEEDDDLAIIDKPRMRGRKPLFPLSKWKPIVLKWENRDPILDTMTLTELLSEAFGTCADGTPMVSEQTYYTWRDRVFEDMKKKAKSRKASSQKT